MKVSVRLFAIARELAGTDQIELALSPDPTIASLRSEIAKRVPELEPIVAHSLFSVGTDYAKDETRITPDDKIAMIPPVSGG